MYNSQEVKVYLKKSNLTLQIDINGKSYTYIDLERCNTSAQALDWLYHIMSKQWCTPEVIYQVLEELNNASEEILGGSIQAKLCPFGESKQIDWTNPGYP